MNEDERREFAEIARKIVYLADKARREGILELEADLDTISVKSEKNTLFLKKLLSLVVDGVDNSIIRTSVKCISALTRKALLRKRVSLRFLTAFSRFKWEIIPELLRKNLLHTRGF